MKTSLNEIVNKLRNSNNYWESFYETKGFELGVLVLDVGQKDVQSPHKSDEVYFVISGNGKLTIDNKDFEIKPHNAYFVPKGTPHHFHGNSEPIIAYYALN